jgi:hypothetical protein
MSSEVTTLDQDALWKGLKEIRSNDSHRERLTNAGRSIVAEKEASSISGWLQREMGVL